MWRLKINYPVLRIGDCAGSYFIYCINKGLGIVTIETSDHLGLSIVREDHCDQGNAFGHGKGMSD